MLDSLAWSFDLRRLAEGDLLKDLAKRLGDAATRVLLAQTAQSIHFERILDLTQGFGLAKLMAN